MADNRFSNNDFEDIYSNSSKNDEFQDIFSNSSDEDLYEDVSSFSGKPVKKTSEEYDEYYDGDFTVKYNSAVQNRRRQEIQYDDISDVYGDISSDSDNHKKKKHNRDYNKENTSALQKPECGTSVFHVCKIKKLGNYTYRFSKTKAICDKPFCYLVKHDN